MKGRPTAKKPSRTDRIFKAHNFQIIFNLFNHIKWNWWSKWWQSHIILHHQHIIDNELYLFIFFGLVSLNFTLYTVHIAETSKISSFNHSINKQKGESRANTVFKAAFFIFITSNTAIFSSFNITNKWTISLHLHNVFLK